METRFEQYFDGFEGYAVPEIRIVCGLQHLHSFFGISALAFQTEKPFLGLSVKDVDDGLDVVTHGDVLLADVESGHLVLHGEALNLVRG